jgi:hypothetical protein
MQLKAILATQFDNFDKGRIHNIGCCSVLIIGHCRLGSVLYLQFRDFLGSGVFNSDGKFRKVGNYCLLKLSN